MPTGQQDDRIKRLTETIEYLGGIPANEIPELKALLDKYEAGETSEDSVVMVLVKIVEKLV